MQTVTQATRPCRGCQKRCPGSPLPACRPRAVRPGWRIRMGIEPRSNFNRCAAALRRRARVTRPGRGRRHGCVRTPGRAAAAASAVVRDTVGQDARCVARCMRDSGPATMRDERIGSSRPVGCETRSAAANPRKQPSPSPLRNGTFGQNRFEERGGTIRYRSRKCKDPAGLTAEPDPCVTATNGMDDASARSGSRRAQRLQAQRERVERHLRRPQRKTRRLRRHARRAH